VAALYAVGLLVFVGLPGRIGGPSGRDVTSVVASLGAGFREAWREPTVRAVLLITVMMNVLFFPYQHMLPVFARHVLSVGPEWLGGLVAADGLGALLGALAIAGRRGFPAARAHLRSGGPDTRRSCCSASRAPLAVGLPCVLVLIGACESAFAAMQSTLVLCRLRRRAAGGRWASSRPASAPSRPAPSGSASSPGASGCRPAMAINGMAALVAMLPAAWPLPAGAGFDPLLTDFTKYPTFMAGYRDRRGGPGGANRFPSPRRPHEDDARGPTLILVAALSLSLPGATSLAQEVLTKRLGDPDGQGPACPRRSSSPRSSRPRPSSTSRPTRLVSLKKAGFRPKCSRPWWPQAPARRPSTAAAATPAPAGARPRAERSRPRT